MNTLLTQGISIPQLGFGTFRMPGGDCQPAVESALEVGYRHIDTAEMYQNEAAVGAAIAAAALPREALHVTTKVWHEHLGPGAIERALESSLAKLGLDYVDLYMIHWPAAGMNLPAALQVLEAQRQAGRIRAIGVCNFNLPLLRLAVEEVGAAIACHQVEYHPFLDQGPMLAYLRSQRIPLVAYAPLAQGRAAADPTLARIGSKHGASAAQIAIAWLLDQPGVIAIPKAQRRASQVANLQAVNLRLDDQDRAAIAALPKGQRFVTPPFAPRWDA